MSGEPASAQIVQGRAVHTVCAGQTLQAALDSLTIPAELYLAVRDGELVQADEILQAGDQVRLVGVLAGG